MSAKLTTGEREALDFAVCSVGGRWLLSTVADTVERILAERIADELDDAAEDYPEQDDGLLGGPPHWLRTRAAAIRGDTP